LVGLSVQVSRGGGCRVDREVGGVLV
jgi:hypothetical protein